MHSWAIRPPVTSLVASDQVSFMLIGALVFLCYVMLFVSLPCVGFRFILAENQHNMPNIYIIIK